MHPPEVKDEALRLIGDGLNDCEVSRRLAVPRSTVRDWRRPRDVKRRDFESCLRCWGASRPVRFSIEDYVELLGLYLGDGSISRMARTWRLRITLDARYQGIVDDCAALLRRCFPQNSVDLVRRRDGAVDVSVYHRHLPCVLPQHGAGRKHERRIAVEAWQLGLILAAPWPFIRGCIRTDGSVFVNRTGRYEYLSYHFGNRSRDVANLLALALRHAGVEYRPTSGCRRGNQNLRINQRPSVALMLENVGLKL